MLTESRIKQTSPRQKRYGIADGKGLSLLIYPNGNKYWCYRYRFEGKANMISLGPYPEISLNEARNRLTKARADRAMGIDPSKKRKEEKQETATKWENTFEKVAREWYGQQKGKWKSAVHANDVIRRLERNLFPVLGHLPIKEIKSRDLLAAIRQIEDRGTLEIAHRCNQMCSQIFRYAVIEEYADYDITSALKGRLKNKKRAKHHTSISPHQGLPEFLIALEQYNGELLTKLAFRLIILTFVRTNELREATWDEIHWDAQYWRIPETRMKMEREHIVPLSHQAIDILNRLKGISGNSPYICPNVNNPKDNMSENTLLYALYRMGYHSRATVHGFRSTASTALREMGFHRDYVEMQLAHLVEENSSEGAYNAALYLPQREEMMQYWADFLDIVREKGVSKEASKEGTKVNLKDFRVRYEANLLRPAHFAGSI